MKKGLPLFLTGIILISLLDSIGSIASRTLHFKYSSLIPISFLIYFLIPFFIAKKANRKTAVIFAALLGLFDATVGFKISLALEANTGNVKHEFSPFVWVAVAVVNTIFATLLGIMRAWMATRFYKLQTTN